LGVFRRKNEFRDFEGQESEFKYEEVIKKEVKKSPLLA